jgi:hypothetical protein
MTTEEFITERTRIISNMLDNPDKYGIYPTTKCFNELDALYDKIIEHDCYPKEFVEWKELKYVYIKSTKDYIILYPYEKNTEYIHYTLDELYSYWKKKVRK